METKIHQYHHPVLPNQQRSHHNVKGNIGFQETLQKVQELQITKHAKERMAQRDINIDENDWNKINTKVSEASKKGVTDSLVLMDQYALIVSNKNKMVVTAMDRTEASSKIFTNINGTILID